MRRSDTLFAEHTFSKADPFKMGTKFPIIIDRANEDGTVQGHYDLDKMSAGKKILAMMR